MFSWTFPWAIKRISGGLGTVNVSAHSSVAWPANLLAVFVAYSKMTWTKGKHQRTTYVYSKKIIDLHLENVTWRILFFIPIKSQHSLRLYCVAPLQLGPLPPVTYDFWLVGKDCCQEGAESISKFRAQTRLARNGQKNFSYFDAFHSDSAFAGKQARLQLWLGSAPTLQWPSWKEASRPHFALCLRVRISWSQKNLLAEGSRKAVVKDPRD